MIILYFTQCFHKVVVNEVSKVGLFEDLYIDLNTLGVLNQYLVLLYDIILVNPVREASIK